MPKIARCVSGSVPALVFIWGLVSCGPRIPVTVSPLEGASPATVKPDESEGMGRLQDCAPGTADCDRDAQNGCEAVLADDPQNCGICGVQCATPHTDAACMGGTCRVIACTPGYRDLDGDPKNGCETAGQPRANKCGLSARRAAAFR